MDICLHYRFSQLSESFSLLNPPSTVHLHFSYSGVGHTIMCIQCDRYSRDSNDMLTVKSEAKSL